MQETASPPDVATDSAADEYGDDFATFGDRIAAARENLSLSQSQLAKRIGVRESTIAKWEEDRAEPRANRLQMLSGILNVSLVWLMTGEGEGVEGDALDNGLDDDLNVKEVLAELRMIRAENRRLSERAGRLEKRLRAILIG